MLNFGLTDIGQVRKKNQDYYYISDDGCVNILADGMGGYAGGEVASKLATLSAKTYIEERFNKNKEYHFVAFNDEKDDKFIKYIEIIKD